MAAPSAVSVQSVAIQLAPRKPVVHSVLLGDQIVSFAFERNYSRLMVSGRFLRRIIRSRAPTACLASIKTKLANRLASGSSVVSKSPSRPIAQVASPPNCDTRVRSCPTGKYASARIGPQTSCSNCLPGSYSSLPDSVNPLSYLLSVSQRSIMPA